VRYGAGMRQVSEKGLSEKKNPQLIPVKWKSGRKRRDEYVHIYEKKTARKRPRNRVRRKIPDTGGWGKSSGGGEK